MLAVFACEGSARCGPLLEDVVCVNAPKPMLARSAQRRTGRGRRHGATVISSDRRAKASAEMSTGLARACRGRPDAFRSVLWTSSSLPYHFRLAGQQQPTLNQIRNWRRAPRLVSCKDCPTIMRPWLFRNLYPIRSDTGSCPPPAPAKPAHGSSPLSVLQVRSRHHWYSHRPSQEIAL